jgi:flagellar biosynthesis anti-sigma factor FlgM
MEISGKMPPLAKTPHVQRTNKPLKNKPVSATRPSSDRVALSPQARALQIAHKAIAKMDDVDAEKVARVKARIAAGTYKIDAKKTANNMIDEALISDLEA